MYYFLKEDFEDLIEKITGLTNQIRKIGQEMGASCKEGAETFHDNFAFEDGERQQYMLSKRLVELIRIRNNARVISPNKDSARVSIGKTIILKDEYTGKTQSVRIGSYMVLKNGNAISYNSPLARILIGAKVGEIRNGKIGGREKKFSIIKIEQQ